MLRDTEGVDVSEGLGTLDADTLDAEGVEVRILVKSEVVAQTLHVTEGDDVPVRRASTIEFSWRTSMARVDLYAGDALIAAREDGVWAITESDTGTKTPVTV